MGAHVSRQVAGRRKGLAAGGAGVGAVRLESNAEEKKKNMAHAFWGERVPLSSDSAKIVEAIFWPWLSYRGP